VETKAERPSPDVDDVVLFEPPPPRRSFAAGDILRLIAGVLFVGIGLIAASFAERTIAGVEADVIDAIGRIPNRFEQTLLGAAQLIAISVPLVSLGVLFWYRRWRLLMHLWLAWIVAGTSARLLLEWLGERSVTSILAERVIADTPLVAADFPSSPYLASAAAIVTVGVAYLPRRWKRAAWSWIALLVLLRLLGPGQPPLDVWIAISVGAVVGSLLLLAFGSPNPEPGPRQLLGALREAGLDPAEIHRRDTPGTHATYETVERNGSRTFVKLRTPDDRSWDLLSRLARAIRLRSSEVSRPYSNLKRRVEHESLALRTSKDGGTRTPAMGCIGSTPGGAVFLIQEYIDGQPLSEFGPDDFDDDLARDVFEQVRALHSTRMAHHRLIPDNFMVDSDRAVWLVDFDEAEIAANEHQRNRDIAEILVAIGLEIGPERTIGLAIEVIGADEVAQSLPMLQPLALSRTLGKSIRQQRGLLDQLRAAIHEATGVDDVPLEKLARVQTRTLFMIIAGALAFYSLLPQFGNLGDTVDAFGDAKWEWIPAMLAAAIAYFVFATISFLGSVAEPMPVAASARSQVANAFAQLVGPASTGKMALAGRFLQRNGLTPAEASASVALNAVAGVATHLLLMVGFFTWAGGANLGGFALPRLRTVLIIAGIAVALIAIGWLIRPIRKRLIVPVIDGLRTAAGYVMLVLRSPIRVLALVVGSTFITLSYMFALVFSVEAFGGDLTIAQMGAAYLGAAAIANIAPTPGGLGALEAAMIAALTGFGLDAGIAISSVLTFRLATFWLPIVPGWATFMWMERRGEI